MKTRRKLKYGIAAASFAGLAAAMPGRLDAQQTAVPEVRIGDSDLGGVVTIQPDRRRVSGLSPRRPICRPNSPRSSSQTTVGVT